MTLEYLPGVGWIRQYILSPHKRHPREMGADKIKPGAGLPRQRLRTGSLLEEMH